MYLAMVFLESHLSKDIAIHLFLGLKLDHQEIPGIDWYGDDIT